MKKENPIKAVNDEIYITEAFKQAQIALQHGECPVGAVLVIKDKIIARSGNREAELCDATAHAEILVIREAGKLMNQRYLPEATLYTTLVPCPMCENAILQAHIPRVVFGSKGFKWIREVRFNTANLAVEGPMMESECRALFVNWAKNTNRIEILDETDR